MPAPAASRLTVDTAMRPLAWRRLLVDDFIAGVAHPRDLCGHACKHGKRTDGLE